MAHTGIAPVSQAAEVARQLVRARLDGTPLQAFPGNLPETLDAAYAIQDAAIRQWPDNICGWKVGRILEPWLTRFGTDRLVGPVFARGLRAVRGGQVLRMPVFEGGFAAVEAEFIVRLAADAPSDKTTWTVQEATDLVAELFAGVEPAASPLAPINDLGPAAIVSDFGNNAGLMVGAAIPGWRERGLDQWATETFIDGKSVGRGTAASVPGGPFAALAFALGCCACRGLPLKAGHLVTTGATTGVHQIRPGQSSRVVFGGLCEIHLVAGIGP